MHISGAYIPHVSSTPVIKGYCKTHSKPVKYKDKGSVVDSSCSVVMEGNRVHVETHLLSAVVAVTTNSIAEENGFAIRHFNEKELEIKFGTTAPLCLCSDVNEFVKDTPFPSEVKAQTENKLFKNLNLLAGFAKP